MTIKDFLHGLNIGFTHSCVATVIFLILFMIYHNNYIKEKEHVQSKLKADLNDLHNQINNKIDKIESLLNEYRKEIKDVLRKQESKVNK